MATYPATVHLVTADGTERPRPIAVRVALRAGAVELTLGDLSGAEALHFALAMCVFNNVTRESRERGIRLRELTVTADGDFDADDLSTGISFSVSIAGDGTEAALRSVAQFAADDSSIARTLRRPTSVALSGIETRVTFGGA
ncbi:MAG: hypothetical protein QOF49_266 [Chloroflexota bacterium]|jgi:uncharacterized OsmC-like protein|nr:hypothetical protein [Chloroflexota bacterium]